MGLSLYTWVFTKTGLGPWLRGDFARGCNKLHSTICIVLLSEFVSLNAWQLTAGLKRGCQWPAGKGFLFIFQSNSDKHHLKSFTWSLSEVIKQLIYDRAHMGSHWQDGLLCRPHKQRIKITVICETDQIALMASCYLTSTYLLKAAKPPDSRPLGYATIPSENFSLVGYKKDSIRKGGCWFFLRVSHPLFSLYCFLFLPDCAAHSLFLCTRLTIYCGFFFKTQTLKKKKKYIYI